MSLPLRSPEVYDSLVGHDARFPKDPAALRVGNEIVHFLPRWQHLPENRDAILTLVAGFVVIAIWLAHP